MKALLIVDYSVDFVADEGALTAGKSAQDLEDYISKTAEDFIQKGDYVIFANDFHEEGDPYHPETKLFSPHNIYETPGHKLYGKLEKVYLEHKDKDNVFWTDKRRYSAFASTEVDLRLRERGINELWIVGVATDICVLHTAVDAYNLSYSMVIPEAGVASFNPTGHKWALDHFEKTLGARVLRKEEEV